jgi:adenine-specific DNA methylase
VLISGIERRGIVMPFSDFMLFAAGESGPSLIGWLVGGGAITFIASVVTNIILLWRERRNAKKESRRDTIDEYEVLLRKKDTEYESISQRLDKVISRHETEILSLEKIVHVLSERCNECDVDMESMVGAMRIMHGTATRMAGAIKAMGGECELVPDLPRRPKRRYPDAEFLSRTVSQSGAAGRAADKMTTEGVVKLPQESDPEMKCENPDGR